MASKPVVKLGRHQGERVLATHVEPFVACCGRYRFQYPFLGACVPGDAWAVIEGLDLDVNLRTAVGVDPPFALDTGLGPAGDKAFAVGGADDLDGDRAGGDPDGEPPGEGVTTITPSTISMRCPGGSSSSASYQANSPASRPVNAEDTPQSLPTPRALDWLGVPLVDMLVPGGAPRTGAGAGPA